MRIEETDIVVYEVDLWKFVHEIEQHVRNGYKIKSYELSVYSPSHNGVAYHTVLEKGADVVADVAEEKPKRIPPGRKPKQD